MTPDAISTGIDRVRDVPRKDIKLRGFSANQTTSYADSVAHCRVAKNRVKGFFASVPAILSVHLIPLFDYAVCLGRGRIVRDSCPSRQLKSGRSIPAMRSNVVRPSASVGLTRVFAQPTRSLRDWFTQEGAAVCSGPRPESDVTAAFRFENSAGCREHTRTLWERWLR